MHVGMAAICQNPFDQRTDGEVYRNELSIGAQAQLIHTMLRRDHRTADDHRLSKLIDPSAAGSESSGFSILDQFSDHGISFDLADNTDRAVVRVDGHRRF